MPKGYRLRVGQRERVSAKGWVGRSKLINGVTTPQGASYYFQPSRLNLHRFKLLNYCNMSKLRFTKKLIKICSYWPKPIAGCFVAGATFFRLKM